MPTKRHQLERQKVTPPPPEMSNVSMPLDELLRPHRRKSASLALLSLSQPTSISVHDLIKSHATPTRTNTAHVPNPKTGHANRRADTKQGMPTKRCAAPATVALKRKWDATTKPSHTDKAKHSALIGYNKKFCGLTTAKDEPMNGKTTYLNGFSKLYNALHDTVISPRAGPPLWKQSLPTRAQLHSKKFG